MDAKLGEYQFISRNIIINTTLAPLGKSKQVCVNDAINTETKNVLDEYHSYFHIRLVGTNIQEVIEVGIVNLWLFFELAPREDIKIPGVYIN